MILLLLGFCLYIAMILYAVMSLAVLFVIAFVVLVLVMAGPDPKDAPPLPDRPWRDR